MRGDLTFLSLTHARKIPPSRDNAERLRLMRARLTPVVGNGIFNFPGGNGFKWEGPPGIKVWLRGVR
jgi:hypothetical protein